MSARSKARKRAVDILFESDLRGTDAVTTAADRIADPDRPLQPYAITLVEGVTAHRERIDELVSTYAEGWSLSRMPGVDRAIIRAAVYELMWVDDVPDAVVIDEAVELAKTLSTDESPRFVNGLLGRLAKVKPDITV
ncbi:transcription antitermination factor NusB [Epidermidibacterium keratini]|uniref:Transcription antitermination protein NusB n=1 Tax=Epidermidibacterium keratini TaxID=1891644 RepID=A0A7L4YJK4_9ACTN|nr:transcription antitermination factor NusB [Epidermidibacterium keratini]QHB99033.1 transcription antitermination factor NusB [Epidermidibacterium keratini]